MYIKLYLVLYIFVIFLFFNLVIWLLQSRSKVNGQTEKFAQVEFSRYTESVKFRSQS